MTFLRGDLLIAALFCLGICLSCRDNATLIELAALDPLNPCWQSKRPWTASFDIAMAELPASRHPIRSAGAFDLDWFKEVNDVHGHKAGRSGADGVQNPDSPSRAAENLNRLFRMGGEEVLYSCYRTVDRQGLEQAASTSA